MNMRFFVILLSDYKKNCNILIKSSNLIAHNSKSVNSNNNKNINIKIGNNLVIKTVNEGMNNLRKENIYGNKNNYNFNNNNHGIISNMNNNTSKNKKKNEVSNSSNLNLGMLSFSASNISSINNKISTSNNSNNLTDNISNNINIIKNSKIKDNNEIKHDQNKNNILNNVNNEEKEKISKLMTNNDNNKDIQTRSAEQTTRNPKFFNNESVYNTNYIINVIDSNEAKNGGFCGNNKENNNNNQAYILGQKDIKNKNFNNDAYKELTNITKNNINEILSKKNVKIPNSYEGTNKEEKNNDNNYEKCFQLSNGKKYKNPEELHFSMIKISQNINRLKKKF